MKWKNASAAVWPAVVIDTSEKSAMITELAKRILELLTRLFGLVGVDTAGVVDLLV
jgi:hypothetical protein